MYFDLEATGLKRSGKPKIIKLSFVAVHIQYILDFNLKIEDCKENSNPRVISDKIEKCLTKVLKKLTLCLYPMATIVSQVSITTGYNLSDQAGFDENTADMLSSFLNCLPSPVFLIVHNGDLCDFPLLKT